MALGDLNYKGFLTGDDLWGIVIDERTPYMKRGIEMKPYLVVPSPDLIAAYPHILKKPGILNIDTPKGKGLWVEYPTYWVVDANPSRKNAVTRVLCAFDGSKTVHTKRESSLSMEIKKLNQELDDERLAYIQLQEDYQYARKELLEAAKHFGEITSVIKGERKKEDDETEETK